MKILFLEWKSFGNQYLMEALEEKGYEVISLPFPRETQDTRKSEKLARSIAEKILQIKCDYVFSFNFFPVAAIACQACKTIYVSWVYDSPCIQLYSETVRFATNRIFLFDSAEVLKLQSLGIDTVQYLPMAAPVKSLEQKTINLEKRQKYQCDIAFVGSTYQEKDQNRYQYLEHLDAYTKGYLEAAMEAQKHVYGCNFMEQILTQEVMERVCKVIPLSRNTDGFETLPWVFSNYFLDRKITAMERAEVLTLLSKKWKVHLYTAENTDFMQNIKNCGRVDYYTAAPYAFKGAKVNLNITLKSIVNGIPLRAMDIMGSGGFLLTNYQADFLEFFEPDRDFVFYENYRDLEQKAEYYLLHDSEREEIARNGQEKVKKFHSFAQRVERLFPESGL